ncbi:excalibur calcium-binding domain-containing protein [Deinococcus sedimenti]|uniref:Excalibur calcium-binding domain-containing protein n=1 Tax=Deinococcus sedimenti TaxID=1867090 RepID=A0ABQ2S7Z7_9DEIO|nr:hypothetical protein GCM10008960_36300 [Deinococcus sedimenti]
MRNPMEKLLIPLLLTSSLAHAVSPIPPLQGSAATPITIQLEADGKKPAGPKTYPTGTDLYIYSCTATRCNVFVPISMRPGYAPRALIKVPAEYTCTSLRHYGMTSITKREASYRSALDPDRDGVACEGK